MKLRHNTRTALKTLLALSLIGCTATWYASAADAQANWDKNCAACHGKDGKGDTRMGQKLGLKDYSDPKVQASFTDEQATKAIKEGVEENGKHKMKAFGDKFSDEEIKALVAHIRSFKKS